MNKGSSVTYWFNKLCLSTQSIITTTNALMREKDIYIITCIYCIKRLNEWK